MRELGVRYAVTSFSINGVTEWYPVVHEEVVFPVAISWDYAPEQATFTVAQDYATFTVPENAIDELTAKAQTEHRSVLNLVVEDVQAMDCYRFDGIADWYPVFLKSLDEPEIDWSHFDGYLVAGYQDSLSKLIRDISERGWADGIDDSLADTDQTTPRRQRREFTSKR